MRRANLQDSETLLENASDIVLPRTAVGRGGCVASLPIATPINCIAWNPDGRTLAVACMNDRIYLWDVGSEKLPMVLAELPMVE
jgi:WD40 repeat protein